MSAWLLSDARLMLRRPLPYVLATCMWFAVLFYLSAQPGSGKPMLFQFQDKVLHFSCFFAGSWCFGRALQLRWPALPIAKFTLAVLAFAALTGAFDEFHQTFTPGRSGNDPFDWLADLLGGYTAARVLGWWR
jgi:VanZ family protein